MRMVLFLCGLPSQILEPSSNSEENTGKIPKGRHSSKYPTSTPQNRPGHQKQGKQEEQIVRRSVKET